MRPSRGGAKPAQRATRGRGQSPRKSRGHGRLTAKQRRDLPEDAFGMPERRAYPLGRPNYQSGGWIADPDHIAAAKARAKQMLDAGELKPADYRRIIRRANAAAKRTKAKSNPEAVSALIRYEELHWGDQGEWDFRDVDRVPDPTKGTPVVLGELIQVVYRTVKEGDGKSDYFHDFKRKRPFLVETEDGGLAILGGDYRVEARGIVG